MAISAKRWIVLKLLFGPFGRPRVLSGPFASMRYLTKSAMSAYYPKILGTYERELHDVVQRIIALEPDLIVDVGAAEGYYAVGFARRLPATRVIAYEIDPEGRRLMKELAALNEVSNLSIRGEGSPERLSSDLASEGVRVVVCDAEGAERTILDPESLPGLTDSHVLVEVHDHLDPTIGTTLEERFSGTHGREKIVSCGREPSGDGDRLPGRLGGFLPRSLGGRLVDEWRGDEAIYWFWFEPLATPDGGAGPVPLQRTPSPSA